ncbi:MAG TPA: restriction endonuclease subunit S [Ramlibacter sp.]|jgi:type I restriction enzyme S subunit|uniref:restriction endonuclease subunit S n=1 Tax=Ramlibacter sp. TaxID=1917967 RepID=UPI002D580FCE|nr:restriction endonuclease subunit S [Ramlibacter sp.]HZY19403.1 restriction endonuclease subunit S [Ramlibacter sp.]
MQSELPWFKLEDVVEDIVDRRGVTPLKLGGDFTSMGHRVVSAKLVKGGRVQLDADEARFVDERLYRKWMRTPLRRGDVIMTSEAPLGEVAFLGEDVDWVLGQRLFAIRPQAGRLHGRFLYYALQSDKVRADILGRASGTTVQGIRQAELRLVQVPVPEFHKQVEISELLGVLDDRIDLLREANITLESIAQALFKSWFVDFEPVRAKAEDREPEGMDAATAALFPAHFEESALGLIPKGWSYRPAEQLFDVGIGKTPPRKEPQWFSEGDGDVRWLSIKDMGDEGAIASRSSEFLSHEAVSKFNVRIVPSRTVLVSFKLTVGRLSITDGPMCTNEAIAHFKARGDSPPFTYLYCYLKAFDFRTLGSTSSIADATNSKAVKALPVLVPSRELVAAFHSAVNALFERMYVQKVHWRTLEDLRGTLLPGLISGKLRLADAHSRLEEATA